MVAEMLELVDVHTYYGESFILRGISLKVEKDSVVALLGRNGMGKTTIIRSIIGFTPPRRGVIRFKEKDITHLQSHQIAQMGIGLVPQGRQIFSSLSVEENLMMTARTRGKGKAWSIDQVYSRFPVLEERAHCRGNQISGGEQQMLAIGRALMTNPDLLLMDEPSEGLAPIIIKEIASIIRQLKESGFCILLVEQNLPMALSVADYICLISKGVVVHECAPNELRDNEEVKTKYLGAAREKH
jgi:branched-chain amino acid transport system ATP-binding protein